MMIPAYNRRGAPLSIRDGNPTSFLEENTSMSYLGFEPEADSVTSGESYPPYWLSTIFDVVAIDIETFVVTYKQFEETFTLVRHGVLKFKEMLHNLLSPLL
ncbi:hypothetical protein TNCV_4828281 [Trichonephila clavipes]|uniref:Uncharacterized protein n=1 Tax=Trichonephila clavipes TaxID=2585209 RepID=A0A8X6SNL9_TRICX|nr:hypothetical protein TNCV_4828281 [Trichonephila clavipes]